MRVELLLIAALAGGCEGPPERVGSVVLRGEAMGTGWTVSLVGSAPAGVRGRVAGVIGEVEAAMSTWLEDSEVSRFNRLGGGEGMVLSEATAEVVGCGLEVWRASGGLFDMTVGSGVEGGSENLAFEVATGKLTKKRDGILIDLSAIAKGYAVDKVTEELERLGVENYLVEIGGELRGKGKAADGEAWTVGIERPEIGGGRIAGTVELSGMSVATSGNYRQRRHLIDPSTGEAVDAEMMSVCVLHRSAMVADAWATALFVAGAEKGIRLADGAGLAAAYLGGEGVGVKASKSFRWKGERR